LYQTQFVQTRDLLIVAENDSSTTCTNNFFSSYSHQLYALTRVVPKQPGVDTALFRKLRQHDKRQANCPFNTNRELAAPYNPKFLYTGARNRLPCTGKCYIKLPADGDTAHAFKAPTSDDTRGPCPSLNAAADVRVTPIQPSTVLLTSHSTTF
jgi:hypothetical protein